MEWLRRNDTYKRQYKKRKVECIEQHQDSSVLEDGVTQDKTMHVPSGHLDIPDTSYIEFDSGLFEPVLTGFDDEDHVEAPQTYDIADNDNEEAMQFQQDDGYESYHVDVKGVNGIGTDDPHDYVYHC